MSIGDKYNKTFWTLYEAGAIHDVKELEYLLDKVVAHYVMAGEYETRLSRIDSATQTLDVIKEGLKVFKTDLIISDRENPIYPTIEAAVADMHAKLTVMANGQSISEKFEEVEHSSFWSENDREFHAMYGRWASIKSLNRKN